MPDFLPALRTKRTPVTGTTALSARERKEILFQGYYSLANGGGVTGVVGRQIDVDRAVREGYLRVVWVYKSVEAISGNQSRLPVQLLDGANPVTDHPLLTLLNGRANPLETGRRFRKRLSQQILLSPKGAFVEIGMSRGGTPIRLDLLPPARTRIVPARDGSVDHYEVMPIGASGAVSPANVRRLDPDVVRWVGEPHPTDPYACVTPLQSASLSVELSHFARLFNRQFMANDGRPGGILGVTADDDVDEGEMDRVERKFGQGPMDAGRLVVLAGGLDYVDVAKTPRDGAWGDTMDRSKDEILVAFGVPESQIGHAANSRYLNAAVEAVSFWQITMAPHNDLVLSTFGDDVDEGLTLAFDVSSVDALHVAEQQRRQELREEFTLGLITADYYAEQTGRPVMNVPGTRSLWRAVAVPIAPNAQDQVAVAKLAPSGGGTQAAPMRGGAAGQPGGGNGSGPNGRSQVGGIPGTEGIAAQQNGNPYNVSSTAEAVGAGTKALAATRSSRARKSGPARRPTPDDEKEDERVRDRVEDALAASLRDIATRQVEVAVARLSGTKARKGTRHWQGAVATKTIDVTYVVIPDRWGDEADQVTEQTLTPAALGYGERMQEYLADDGVDTTANQDGSTVPPMPSPGPGGVGLDAHPLVVAALIAARRSARQAAVARAERMRERLAAAEEAGGSIEDLVAALRGGSAEVPAPAGAGDALSLLRGMGEPDAWARAVASTAATTGLEGTRNAVLAAAGNRVRRTWRTRLDDRVRHAHAVAEGQEVVGDERFVVGGERARYPGDPDLSPAQRVNCRCYIGYHVAAPAESSDSGTDEGKAFDAAKHPRDRHGRFASIGEVVHVLDGEHSGTAGKVVGTPDAQHVTIATPDGRITVRSHDVEHHEGAAAPAAAKPAGAAAQGPDAAAPADASGSGPSAPAAPRPTTAAPAPAHSKGDDLPMPTGLSFVPAHDQTHARCRHGEVLPIGKFPTMSGGKRGTECRAHRDARRAGQGVPPVVDLDDRPEHVRATEAARQLIGDPASFGRTQKRLDDDDYLTELRGKIDKQTADRDRWQKALDEGVDPRTGEKLREGREEWSDEHATYIPGRSDAQDYVDQYESTRASLQAKHDEYRAHLAKAYGSDEVVDSVDFTRTGFGPGAETQAKLDALRRSGAAIDAEVQRRVADRLQAHPDYVSPEEDERRSQLWINARPGDETVNADHMRLEEQRAAVEWERKRLTAEVSREVLGELVDLGGVEHALTGVPQTERVGPKAIRVGDTLMMDGSPRKVEAVDPQPAGGVELKIEGYRVGQQIGANATVERVTGTGVRPEHESAVRLAETCYPRDWLTTSAAAGDMRVVESTTGRGYYAHGTQELALSSYGARAHWPGQGPHDSVGVHELAHRMEETVPGVKGAEWAYYVSRCGRYVPDEDHWELDEATPLGGGYQPEEVTRKDEWRDRYNGKSYNGGNDPMPQNPYEILTMGVQSVFAGEDYADDDHRAFVYGALATLAAPRADVPQPEKKRKEPEKPAHVAAVEAARAALPEDRSEIGKRGRVRVADDDRAASYQAIIDEYTAVAAKPRKQQETWAKKQIRKTRGYLPTDHAELVDEEIDGIGPSIENARQSLDERLADLRNTDPTYDAATDTIHATRYGRTAYDTRTLPTVGEVPGERTIAMVEQVKTAGVALRDEIARRVDLAGLQTAVDDAEQATKAADAASTELRFGPMERAREIKRDVVSQYGLDPMDFPASERTSRVNAVVNGRHAEVIESAGGIRRFRYLTAIGQAENPYGGWETAEDGDTVEMLDANRRATTARGHADTWRRIAQEVTQTTANDPDMVRLAAEQIAASARAKNAREAEKAARSALGRARRDAAVEVLREVRELGATDDVRIATTTTRGRDDLEAAFRHGEQFYPREWIARAMSQSRTGQADTHGFQTWGHPAEHTKIGEYLIVDGQPRKVLTVRQEGEEYGKRTIVVTAEGVDGERTYPERSAVRSAVLDDAGQPKKQQAVRPVAITGAGRGSYGMGVMKLSKGSGALDDAPDMARVATHEIGHLMEERVEGIKALEWAYQWTRTHEVNEKTGTVKRTGDNALRRMEGYSGRERARKDKYHTAYTGKEYEGGPEGSWELLTTAAESLFAGSPYLDGDDDLQAWVLGILATV